MWKSCVKACRSGFTLIELLVVIAIIAILAAILFPVFSQAREKARQAQDTSNVRNIGMATAQYAQDYDERFMFWRTPCWVGGISVMYDPPVPVKMEPYVRNRQVFKCPSTGRDWSWPLACAGDDPQANRQRGWWSCGGSYGIGVGRPEWTFFTSHGYNEFVQNDADGYGGLSRIRTPAEFVLWGDSETAFFTPWGMGNNWGVFAGGYVVRLCWPEFWSSNVADYNERNAGRHLQGSILSFADGHAKWYHWRNIRMKRYGGSLSFMRCDEEPCSPSTWY
ncbi:MAG: type II secretion system protein [Candidatus Fervidibacter sp.]|uniref:type II secretion system protein n=2 Tax=Candidatus Fervidibacter sp. TaxID=3100871 RepID=UPI00404A0972